jgi:hypothetical protein
MTIHDGLLLDTENVSHCLDIEAYDGAHGAECYLEGHEVKPVSWDMEISADAAVEVNQMET